jgi:hypothetical protein
MADNTQNTQILLKRSDVPGAIPTSANLALGEPAVNTHDGRLFLKLSDGKIVDIGSAVVGNTYYVTMNGDDANDGTSENRAKATIRAAIALANPGDTVKISTGNYTEETPILIPQSVQVVGSGERGCIIKPKDSTKDIFWVNNNSYILGLKYIDYSGSAIAFPESSIEANTIVTATANTITLPTSSYNVDDYYVGMQITLLSGTLSGNSKNIISYQSNTKVATLDSNWTSIPEANTSYSLGIPLRYSPASANSKWSTYITGSPYIYNSSSITSLGGTGLKIDGSRATGNKSMISAQFTQVNQNGKGVHILNDGYSQLVSIYGIFCDVAFLAESGGSASMGNCNVNFGNKGLVANGKGALAMTAILNGTQAANNNSLNVRSIVANSTFVTSTIPFATMVMKIVGDDPSTFYSVDSATPLDANGNSTVTFVSSNTTIFPSGTQLNFYQQSQLRASAQTFEFVGAGTNINAIPRLGGVANSANQITTIAEGAVYATSTDEQGNFQVGDLILNQGTATISGRTFTKSLFAVMTPYILALED